MSKLPVLAQLSSINKILNQKLTIPKQSSTNDVNSLNVATAAAIFLSEIFRKT